jgi:hypothetical protein
MGELRGPLGGACWVFGHVSLLGGHSVVPGGRAVCVEDPSSPRREGLQNTIVRCASLRFSRCEVEVRLRCGMAACEVGRSEDRVWGGWFSLYSRHLREPWAKFHLKSQQIGAGSRPLQKLSRGSAIARESTLAPESCACPFGGPQIPAATASSRAELCRSHASPAAPASSRTFCSLRSTSPIPHHMQN